MIVDKIKTRVVSVVISLDKTTCALVDLRGNILAMDSFPTSEYPQISDYVSVLAEHILELVQKNGGEEEIRSVGISSPSGNYQTGSIESSPNMPWKGVVPLAAMLRDRLGIAVALGNNAHVLALGEQTFGAAHGIRDFIVVSLGSGLGSCVFCDGKAHLGVDGFAGEVGHTCVVPDGRLCGCGHRGCLETYTAAKGIVTTARELLAEEQRPSLLREVSEITPRIVWEFCDQGDELAIETFRRTGYMLGLGLANYASYFNPEAIIFTDGIAQAGKWLLEPTWESFDAHVFHNQQGKVKFIVSTLDGQQRELLGASVLAWEVKEYSLFK